MAGTFSKNSATSGKPALADVVDRGSTENPDPPSSYCEVYINDKLVYRTRTKQFTPLPYFNAVSERFIHDWTEAKVTFVIRDDRDREHGRCIRGREVLLIIDPVLGLVNFRLRDALADRTQFTRWCPLVGGLGWGRLRLSLLYKPVDIRLPRNISGFQVATLEILSLPVDVIVETDADRCLYTEPTRLAVEYRHSSTVTFTYKKSSGSLRLDDIVDDEVTERRIKLEPEGSLSISLMLHPGVSRIHEKLSKRDLRFRRVYEVWEMVNELEGEEDSSSEEGAIAERRAHSKALHKKVCSPSVHR